MGTKVKAPETNSNPADAAERLRKMIKPSNPTKSNINPEQDITATQSSSNEGPAEFDQYGRIKNRHFSENDGSR